MQEKKFIDIMARNFVSIRKSFFQVFIKPFALNVLHLILGVHSARLMAKFDNEVAINLALSMYFNL